MPVANFCRVTVGDLHDVKFKHNNTLITFCKFRTRKLSSINYPELRFGCVDKFIIVVYASVYTI